MTKPGAVRWPEVGTRTPRCQAYRQQSDRNVFGCINDMADLCEDAVPRSGSLASTDFPCLNRHPRQNMGEVRCQNAVKPTRKTEEPVLSHRLRPSVSWLVLVGGMITKPCELLERLFPTIVSTASCQKAPHCDFRQT